MNIKNTAAILLLILGFNAFAQTTTKDSLKIEIVKAKLVDNVSVVGIRELKVTDDALRKVMIKTKIRSTVDNRTKLSAFSLLDTKNKIRFRLADYKGYMGAIGFPELIPFRKDKIYNKRGKEINGNFLPKYDPYESDYFNDYEFKGYTNFELKINFGTEENPQLTVLYFGESSFDKFTAELFFAVPVTNTNSTYELYYKDEKISDIKFE